MVVGKLARGAISLTGNIVGKFSGKSNTDESEGEFFLPEDGLPLRCVSKEKLGLEASSPGLAGVNPEEPLLQPLLTAAGTCWLTLKTGSDCVLALRALPAVPLGCIALDEAQRHNLFLSDGIEGRFDLFQAPSDGSFTLTDLSAEVRLRGSTNPSIVEEARQVTRQQEQNGRQQAAGPAAAGEEDSEYVMVEGGCLEVDAVALTKLFSKALFGRVVVVGETVPVRVQGHELVLRVQAANNLTEEDQADVVAYHCFRGLVSADTKVYISAAEGLDRGLQLTNVVPRPPAGATGHLVNCTTSDGEWFPVKKRLLRGCIALTKQVQDKGPTAPSVDVQVGCLTFDRVLLFLEAEALGRAGEFNLDINQAAEMLAAAQWLGCRPLEDLCLQRMGEFESRIREYTFDEVKAANASDKVWILIDFMVLDVTRWLPEHPGGWKIIPAQALDMDATCFFELYHSSRESFMYLKHFYIGELQEEDRDSVPCATKASEEFLEQLRMYTQFRIETKPLVPEIKHL